MNEGTNGYDDDCSGMTIEGKLAAKAAVAHLRSSIESDKHWYLALLEAIGLWAATQEVYKGRFLHYVIGGEAFDWLVLARRLCDGVDNLIPESEREGFFSRGEPPIAVKIEQFKKLVGTAKYRALLNYWYGVEVEVALVKAIGETIRKERVSAGITSKKDLTEVAYQRAYGSPRSDLIDIFSRENKRLPGPTLSDTEAKEFTYWLFKYRLEKHDKAKVASDTKQGLLYLERHLDKKSPAPFPTFNSI